MTLDEYIKQLERRIEILERFAGGLAEAYPVGTVYVNATDSTNPATLLGFGTWVTFSDLGNTSGYAWKRTA